MKKRPMCLVCLGLALGIWLIRLLGLPVFGEPEKERLEPLVQSEETVQVRGQVQDYERKDNSKSYLITSCVLKVQENEIPVKKLYLITQQEEMFAIGSIIETEGTLEKPEAPTNPGQFDTAGWYASQGIFYTMWAEELRAVRMAEPGIREGMKQLRTQMSERLSLMLPESRAGILSAMLIGDKSLLDPEIRAVYQAGGVLHVLSISGLHLSMLGMGLFRLLQRLGCHRFLSSGLAIAGMAAYTVFTGNGVATRRAFYMFVILTAAGLVGRTYDSLSALALAAVITLIGQPETLSYSGFLLSYTAVLGTSLVWPVWKKGMFCREHVEKAEEKKRKNPKRKTSKRETRKREGRKKETPAQKWKERESEWGKSLKQNAASCMLITLTTLPLTTYFFYEIPVFSIVPNLILLPTMAWVMGSGILGCCLGLFSVPLGKLALLPASLLLGLYEAVMKGIQRIPGAVWICGQPTPVGILVFYMLLTAVLLAISRISREENMEKPTARFWRSPRGTALCAAILVLATACLLVRRNPPLSVTALDVGQGDALVVRKGGGITWLIDGGSSDEKNVGNYRILPYLKSQGIRTLDAVIVTHSDEDHVNGIRELLEMSGKGMTVLRIRRLLLPLWMQGGECAAELEELAGKAGAAVAYLRKGDRITAGELTLKVLHPDDESYEEEPNAGSVVLSLHYKEFDALLTGDVQGEGEEKLWRQLEENPFQYDYLKVAHHGSRNSTPEELLAIVQPEISVISCSSSGRYGHPHRELLQRLEDVGTDYYVTADAGALICTTDGLRCTMIGYRNRSAG